MPPPTTTSSGVNVSSRVMRTTLDELGGHARDRLVDELAPAVLGVATQHAFRIDAYWPTFMSGGE